MSAAPSSKIAIIGSGSVGSTIAYSLLSSKVAGEILLVDIDEQRVEGQVLDLKDGSEDAGIRGCSFKEAGQADIICITAGAKQKPGESRTDLISRNHDILKNVITSLFPIKQSSILIIIANPCDVLTYFAIKLSGLPQSQILSACVIISGPRLALLRVLGEHGDSQFVAWSTASIGNVPLKEFYEDIPSFNKEDCSAYVRDKAQKIIEAKGSTFFGIASCVKSLCSTILLDASHVRSISHYLEEYGVCLSLPCVLNRNGINRTLYPPLCPDELSKLRSSAAALKAIISQYE